MSRSAGMALALCAVVACAPVPDHSPLVVTELDSPAGDGSGMPHLAARDGALYMSWIEERPGGGHALRFSSHDGRGWEVPRTIADLLAEPPS